MVKGSKGKLGNIAKKTTAVMTLLTMSGGLGAFFNGAIKEYRAVKNEELIHLNEKRIIKLEGQTNANRDNINRVYNKLDSIDGTQKQILILLQK